MNQHPIQLRDITIKTLNLTVNDPNVARDYQGELTLRIELGSTEFSAEDPLISVGLRVQTEPKEAATTKFAANRNPSFSVEVELLGHFVVDYAHFKFEHLTEWSQINAPYLLLPYVREQVYGLAIRAGIRGLLFPLFVQPRLIPKSATNAVKLN